MTRRWLAVLVRDPVLISVGHVLTLRIVPAPGLVIQFSPGQVATCRVSHLYVIIFLGNPSAFAGKILHTGVIF